MQQHKQHIAKIGIQYIIVAIATLLITSLARAELKFSDTYDNITMPYICVIIPRTINVVIHPL